MKLKGKGMNILDRFCTEFCRIAEKHCTYIVVSGFLAISSGRARGTEDIDMIIERLDLPRFSRLHFELAAKGFACMQGDSAEEVFSYLADNIGVRYMYQDRPMPNMEVKFAKDRLDELQLEKRAKLPLTGLDIWFGSVAMNIAFKEELLKSEKDLEDARHLRIVYSELVDEKEINGFKALIRRYRL